MSAFLKIIISAFITWVLPLLRQYVQQTQTTLDDAALDELVKLLQDGGFMTAAEQHKLMVAAPKTATEGCCDHKCCCQETVCACAVALDKALCHYEQCCAEECS